jgi:predicted Zn-dependent peptidase
VPKVEIRIALRTGSVDEPEDRPWLTRLLAHWGTEGAGGLDASALADAFARIGGSVGIAAGEDGSAFVATSLSEHAAEAVRLLGLVLREPEFPESELPRLRADLLRGLSVSATQPGVQAAAPFLKALYGAHPYGRGLPTAEQLARLDRGAVTDFHERFLGAARARVYVGGVFDAAEMRAALARALDGWQAGPAPRTDVATPRVAPGVHLVDRPGAEQSTLYLGLPVMAAGHRDYLPFLVANTLLGGSFYSRIILNIREDKGWSYSPRSAVASKFRCGHWVQVADVTTAHTAAAVTEVIREIERLREEPPGEEELAGIRNYMAGSHVIAHATPSGIVDHASFLDFHGLGDAWSASYIERVHAVTPDDVRRIVREHLRPADMTLSVAGDASVVRAGLEAFGPVTMVSASGAPG